MTTNSDNLVADEARDIEAGETPTAPGGKKRDTFATRAGFILACIGSAVGMANIWLFPYRVAQLGGAAFLIPYFIFVILLGFTGVIGEMSFGRAMRTGPMGAFGKAMEMRGVRNGKTIGKVIGLIPTLGSLAIAIGYAVVLGWAFNYLVASLDGRADGPNRHGGLLLQHRLQFRQRGLPPAGTGSHLPGDDSAGISRGIERANKVLMPTFFVLFLIIAVRVATLPGADAGYMYLLGAPLGGAAEPHHLGVCPGAGVLQPVAGRLRHAGVRQLPEARRERGVRRPQRGHLRHHRRVMRSRLRGGAGGVRFRAGCFQRAAASVHHAGPGVPGDALRRCVRRHPVRGGGVRRHHQPHEPVRGAGRGAARAAAGSPARAAVGVVAIDCRGRWGLFLESGRTVVSVWMDVISIYVIPVGRASRRRSCSSGYVRKRLREEAGRTRDAPSRWANGSISPPATCSCS